MSTEPKSKFIGFIDSDANGSNRRPNIKGEFARAGGELYSFAIWGGAKKDGSGIYLKGKVEPKNVTAALTAKVAPTDDVEQPAGLTLQMGEIVLFENDKGDNDKRPDFYGFSRTKDGINRHSAWGASASTGSLMLRGSTEPYVKAATADAAPTPEPAEPTAKTKVRQALTAKR